MKALGFFLLIGLIYGFEGNNRFIVRQANPTLHSRTITQTDDHLQQSLSKQDLFLEKIQKKFANLKKSMDFGFLSPQRVDEETFMNSELVRAIKREIYHELENIFADDFEENDFFRSFMDDSLKVITNLRKPIKIDLSIFGIKI